MVWESTIVVWSDKYKIDPNLVASIMLVESGGNAEAVSHSGACGLMQAMSSDLTSQYGNMFAGRPTCKELMNPSFNVGWAVNYLAELYHRNGEDWREAIYHYGPNDIQYEYADLVLAHWSNAK